jgi:hypothetical protein
MIAPLHSLFILLLAFAPLLGGSAASAQGFEAEYLRLIDEFAGSLGETTSVEALADRADALYDRIRQYRRESRGDLSKEELDRLRKLYREVLRFKTVTRTVGQVSNVAHASIEGFDAVKDRLGLEPRVLQRLESGLELVRIDVGSFGSILLRNPTKTTFTVTYGVNDPQRPGGIGNAACESFSVMSGLFNSRDREIEDIEFTIQARDTRVSGCD